MNVLTRIWHRWLVGDPTEWHRHTSLFRHPMMRRRVDGQWEYREETSAELADRQQSEAW